MICTQHGCGAAAACKYTWPGSRRDYFACREHALFVVRVADVLGFRLPLLEITDRDRAHAARVVAAEVLVAFRGDDGEE